MPTNFTVVPVEDQEDNSNAGAAAGGSRHISQDKIFNEEEDVVNLQESPSGLNRLYKQMFISIC